MLKPWGLYRVIDLIIITRPHNCLAAAACTLLGAHLVSSADVLYLLSSSVPIAMLVVGLTVAFCNVFNDYQDRFSDSLSKPHRPIPSGRVSPDAARRLALVLFLTVLGSAMILSFWQVAIVVVTLILGISYSYFLKSTILIGNSIVGFLSGLTVIYGALAMGRPTFSAGLAGLLIFLFVFSREILKTILDQDADAAVGVGTVTTRLGEEKSLQLFRISAIGFVVVAAAPWFFRLAPNPYIYTVVPCSILPTVGVIILLSLRATDDAICLSLRVTKLIWFSSLLSIAMLK